MNKGDYVIYMLLSSHDKRIGWLVIGCGRVRQMRGCMDNSCVLLLGQHLNPLTGFHVWALQEDVAGMGSNQRLMWGVKNRMVGWHRLFCTHYEGGNPKRTQLGCPLVIYWVYILCYTYCTLFEYCYAYRHIHNDAWEYYSHNSEV